MNDWIQCEEMQASNILSIMISLPPDEQEKLAKEINEIF